MRRLLISVCCSWLAAAALSGADAPMPMPPADDPLAAALAESLDADDPASAAAWDKRLFDKKGNLVRAAYVRACASLEPRDLDHRLGPDHAFYAGGGKATDKAGADKARPARPAKPDGKAKPAARAEPTVDGFPIDASRHPDGEYHWLTPDKNAVDWTGHGGQVIYLPDRPEATGMAKAMFCWTEHQNHGGKQFWHNYRMRASIDTKDRGIWWCGDPDPALRAQAVLSAFGKDPNRTPSAIARGRCAWANHAIICFRNGLITTSGTGNNGDQKHLVLQLPPGKVPTAAALTPGNEIALVTVWDVNALKGQVAVIALGNTSGHRWMLPTTAFFDRIKLLGFVDLPFATPSSIAASTDTVAHDGFAGDLKPEAFDFNRPETRALWAKGAQGLTRNITTSLPLRAYAVVGSRAESRLAFIDLAPFFAYLRKMYTGSQKDYDLTKAEGPAANQWPFAFSAAPEALPKVVHTMPIPQPTTVAAGFPTQDDAGFGSKAVATTMDGRLVVIDVNTLASASAKPGPIAAVGMVKIGRNPTSIVYGSRQVKPDNGFVVTCRGDRHISWVRVGGGTPSVTRTLSDVRLADPVFAECGDYRGGRFISVADFNGRKIVNYLTAPIDSWGDKLYGGLGKEGTSAFECAGITPVPGRPFLLSGAEVP